MDEDGDIWFAMEEALNLETGRSEFPAPRAVPLASTHRKLGHPSLLENSAKHARIGGEIVYDPLFGEKGWVLSNSSGRYGTSPDRRKEHLDNVAARFGNYGLVFDVYYI
ncbi:hypothetical protein SL003B_2653 [Polymorphum gilvum SL003B-26A1]|uniref:Uncharacterized protein n=2 Tax=Polymorphum TaxID=991903 RepID=F2J4D4_POLGS|nr:hypothetical protein SL003B_2653 [Polymorphum gilvum SL003B-26A1]